MRILMFSNWFPPIRSGSSFYTSSLAQALSARGHDVVVVTLDWRPEYSPADGMPFPIHQLPVIRLPKSPIFYNLQLMGLAFTPGNCRRLKRLICKHDAQVVHLVNHIFDTTFLATWAAHWAGRPIVGSITTPIQHQHPWRQRLMSYADRSLLGLFGVRHWDGIISLDCIVHKYVGQTYGMAAQQRSVVIPFGVRIETMSQYEAPPLQATDRPQILHIGHIHPFRNPVQLVRAMPLILKAVPNARLIFAGRVDLPEAQQVAHDLGIGPAQVEFRGDTPHDEAVRLMKTSHVFASWVTGPFPGLGTAPMEAMLCGTPVVNDLPEDLFGPGKLRNGENIVLVDSRDPKSIAHAIIRLLTDHNIRQKIGSGGKKFVLEHLNWDNIAAQMEQFYAQVLAEFRHAPTGGGD